MSVKWPNTFIVGAAKAGTTSLYSYLQQHPDVFMPSCKEPHFFSRVQPSKTQRHVVPIVNSEADYLKLYRKATSQTIIGDASPSYLWDESAPLRIKRRIPQARIIILLRDPVERAYSHYLMDVRDGLQYRPFIEALQEDIEKKEKGWGISHLYVELGMYYEQTKRFLGLFGTNQVCILMFEDLKQNSMDVLRRVAHFLDIEPRHVDTIDSGTIHNRYAAPRGNLARAIMGNRVIREYGRKLAPRRLRALVRGCLLCQDENKPSMEKEAGIFLQRFYEPDLLKLEMMLGEELPHLRKVWK